MKLIITKDSIIPNLIASVVAMIGSVLVFILCINFDGRYLLLKPEAASLAWKIFSISSLFYYLIRSRATSTSGSYVHPLFRIFLKIIQILPFIGLALSWIDGSEFITESQFWYSIISAATSASNSLIVLLVFAHFGSGLSGIMRYFKINFIK